MPVLTEARMRSLVHDALSAAGLSEAEALACTEASVFADLRGSATHGIVYMVRRTLASIASGNTVPGSRLEIVRDARAACLVRATGVVGPVGAAAAMELAMGKARQSGIGIANAFGGNPIGLLGYYANLAAEQGLVGLVMANTAPSAAPYGAVSAVLGTNPFAYAAPTPDGRSMIFDIATTVASYGKLQQARRAGETLPDDWLIGEDGRPITDPARADEGALLPFGGHKGSGIAILIHLLTGGLSGTTVGGDETHANPDPDKRGQGASYIAIDPASFTSTDGFARMVARQIEFIHNARPLPGRKRPLYPGERGWREMERRRAEGIPVPDSDWSVVVKAIRDAEFPEGELLSGIS